MYEIFILDAVLSVGDKSKLNLTLIYLTRQAVCAAGSLPGYGSECSAGNVSRQTLREEAGMRKCT